MIDGDLEQKDWSSLRDECKRLRNAIRLHRDQVGDDRCILDDNKLYEILPEWKPVRRHMPVNMPHQCKQFIFKRMNHSFTSVDELYREWDKDKPYLSPAEIDIIISYLKNDDVCNKLLRDKLENLK